MQWLFGYGLYDVCGQCWLVVGVMECVFSYRLALSLPPRLLFTNCQVWSVQLVADFIQHTLVIVSWKLFIIILYLYLP